MIAPHSLVAAFGLAKLQEKYLTCGKKSYKPLNQSTSYSLQSSWSQQAVLPRLPSGTSNSSACPLQGVPIQRILPAQMREHHEKGRCYNCDERWHHAHVCKSPKLYLLHGHEVTFEDVNDNPSFEIVEPLELVTEPIIQEVVEPEISLHAILGSIAPKTMRLVGWIHNHRVVILIDFGSTHNFINLDVIPKLSSREIIPLHLTVRVANGGTLSSSGKCPSMIIRVQGTSITSEFFLLSLGGCDVVLGVEWLQTLGPILWDFADMSMKFTFQSHPTTLRGLNPSELTVEDATHFLHSTAALKVFILEIVAKGEGPDFHCPLALFLICCSSLMLFLRNHRVYHLKEHGITRL